MARGRFNLDTVREIQRQLRAEEQPDGTNNRRHGRVRPNSVWCSLGTILDLSASGLRVQGRRPAAGGINVVLRDANRSVTASARVVWCKKTGFRKYEIGLEFVEMSAETAQAIRSLAVFS